jgi:hypothetical protein
MCALWSALFTPRSVLVFAAICRKHNLNTGTATRPLNELHLNGMLSPGGAYMNEAQEAQIDDMICRGTLSSVPMKPSWKDFVVNQGPSKQFTISSSQSIREVAKARARRLAADSAQLKFDRIITRAGLSPVV